jgi:hypothetical protein
LDIAADLGVRLRFGSITEVGSTYMGDKSTAYNFSELESTLVSIPQASVTDESLGIDNHRIAHKTVVAFQCDGKVPTHYVQKNDSKAPCVLEMAVDCTDDDNCS